GRDAAGRTLELRADPRAREPRRARAQRPEAPGVRAPLARLGGPRREEQVRLDAGLRAESEGPDRAPGPRRPRRVPQRRDPRARAVSSPAMDPEGDRAEDLRISRGFVHAVFAYD